MASPEKASSCEHVKLLGSLAFQRKTRITEKDLGLGCTLFQKRKPPVRDLDHLRIDFVTSEAISWFSVSGERVPAPRPITPRCVSARRSKTRRARPTPDFRP